MWFQKPPLGTPLDWENPLNDNLRLALPMNEGHGDVVRDLSGHGNHGTLEGFAFPPTVASGWNPGQTGRGLNLDGTNDYVDCGNNTSLDPTDAITISALVKPEAAIGYVTGFRTIVSKGESASLAYGLYWNSASETIDFRLPVGGTANIAYSYTNHIGLWTNIVATYDRQKMRVYANGNEIGSAVYTAAIGTDVDNLFIGWAGSDRYLPGSIDQPRIVAGAWTAKQCMDYAINPWQVYLDEDDY